LNEDEMKKLKELSESTKKAEVVTAQLLAEAQGLLAEGTRGSRTSSSAQAAREKAKIVNTAGPPEANLTADEEQELSEALMD
jgi:hypothetical protein